MGRHFGFSLAVILGCLSMETIATAEPAPTAMSETDVAKFRSFLQSADYQSRMLKAVDRMSPDVLPRCPALVSSPGQVTLHKVVTFKDGAAPVSGEWVSRNAVKGCGNDTTLNIRFFFDDQGTLKSQNLLPGETIGNPKLQWDAMMYALMGAGSKVPDCKNSHVINTRFEAFGLKNPATSDPGDAARFRPWWETWIVAGCGRKFSVPLDFVPYEAGAHIIQPHDDIREN